MLNYKYYADPFLTELEAEVLEVKPLGQHYHVTLSDTIFYPTGGGQPHDTGWIEDAQVLDVFQQNGRVVHVVDRPLSRGTVRLVLNWERRFYHMQQHTGQHLLSAVCANKYQWTTQGFHLGENYTTIDITTPEVTDEVLAEVEDAVNDIIYQDLPVQAYVLEPEEAEKLPLRKVPTVDEDVRIVEIPGVDLSPCGGTHLKSTGQIGLVKIIRTEKYKGMTRVYFLCGKQARADYSAKHRLVQELGSLLSTALPDLTAKVKAEVDQRRSLEAKVLELQDRLCGYLARELVAASPGRFVYHVLAGDSVEEAQTLARHITTLGQYFAAVETGSRVVLAQSLGKELHVGKLVQEHARPLGGKGGGSAQMAQVFFNDADNLGKFRLFLQEYGERL